MASTVGLLLGGFFMKTRFTSFLFASLLAFSSAVQVSPVQADVNNNTDAKVRDTVVEPEESATPAPAETPSFLPSPSPAASASADTEASPTPAASQTPEETAAASSADPSASVDPEESPASSATPASTSSAALTETDQPAASTETDQPAALTEMDQEASVKADDKLVHDFDAEVFYGGMRRDDGKYVWSARSHAPDHRFSYRVSFGLGDEQSGDDMVFAPGTVKITVPVTVLTDRDGNRADKYEMSIPSMEEVKESEESGTPLDNDVSFAYEEADGQIVITNIRNVDPGFEGFIEMSYLTTEETFAYRDMGQQDMGQQGTFTATITAMDPATVTDTESLNGTWTTPQTRTVDGVYIDTQVTLQQMAERAPAQYDKWQDAWGEKPENDDKYSYFVYEIESVIGDNSQEYAMKVDDEITSLIADDQSINNPGEGYSNTGLPAAKAVAWYSADGAYAIGQRSDRDQDGNSNGRYQKESGLRYDYVIVAVNKKLLTDTNKLEITTRTTATVHPRDDADDSQATSQTFERRFVWNKPVFRGYGGGFGGWVRADGFYRYQSVRDEWPREYFTELGNHASNYSSYNLNDLVKLNNSMPISGLDYAIWTEGYVGQWSIDRNATNPEQGDYFKELVRYEMTDNQFYLSDENNGVSQDEKDRLTSSDDYQIDSLRFNVYAYDAKFDKNRQEFVNSGKVTYDDGEVLTFYVQTGSTDAEWKKAAEYSLKNNEFTIPDSNSKLVKKTDTTIYGGPEIEFTDNVVGYRIETKNKHYYTRIGVVPSVTLKDSPRVKGYYSPDKTESFALNNRTVTTIYDYKDKDGNVLDPGSDGEYQHVVWGPAVAQDADFIRKVENVGSLTKDIVASTNLQKKKEYRVTWKIHADESYNYGQNEKGYTEQNGGTFYDILPTGAVLDPDSIVISTNEGELPSSSYSLKTISTNYPDSGRTLIKITVYDPANWYDLYYDTVHTYEAIRDYGNEAYNSVAYQTGNDSIEGFFQDPDKQTETKVRAYFDRYLSDVKNNTDEKKNAEETMLYDAVKEAGVADPQADMHFLFRGRDGDIEAITAAASGLTKRILSSRSNRYDTSAIVDNDSEYNYRLRFQNSYANTSENIILFDDLENYQKDGRSSDWKGTLKAIDFSALPKDKNGAMLISPVVYYSTEAQNFDGKTAPDLTAWKKLDLENNGSVLEELQGQIRAIAIDLSKTPDGAVYSLGKGEAVSVNLTMAAPSGAARADGTAGYPETYNGILASYDRITASSRRHQVTMEGSTVGQLVISRDVNIKKLSAQDHTTIRGIQFRLSGTSDYGTAIDKIQSTDRNGELTFAKVEKGTYMLMEYGSNPDWLDDHTAYKVVINDAGELWITNPKKSTEAQKYESTKEKTPFWFEVENTPRIHGDLSFYKARQTTATNDALIGIADTTFELSGTSDYGNDVVKTAVSDKNGLVKIQNIEKGTYTLREIKANADYILNNDKYQVVVNDAGSATLYKPVSDQTDTFGPADDIGGQPVIFNMPAYWNVSFLKIDKDLPTRTLEGAQFTITGTSLDQPVAVTSDKNGRVTFTHLKADSYVLTETKAPIGLNGEGKKPVKGKESDGVLNYTADPSKYLLTINEDGTYTITKDGKETLSKNADGDYLFPDERALDGQITIIKKWDDDGKERKSPKIHLYNTETQTEMKGVRVIVEWLNDSVTTRPNSNFAVSVCEPDGTTVSSTDPNVKLTQMGNIWVYNFSDLDASKSYTAYEMNVPDGYTGTAVGSEHAVNVVSGKARIQNVFSYTSTFKYKGHEQQFKAPYSGYYKLEVWGAEGGTDTYPGGKGGYSTGTVYLSEGQLLYVYVGQKGGDRTTGKGGGWNGGGDAGNSGTSGGGGGMTHISTTQNPVNNNSTADQKNDRGKTISWDPKGTIIVAGGGGGGGYTGGKPDQLTGGYGGGETAGQGGAQDAASNAKQKGYKQGYGQNRYDLNVSGNSSDGGGAGAGWYGGYVNPNGDMDFGGGGGTGYVAEKLGQYPITHEQTIAGNMSFPTVDGTGMETGHRGDGFAKITYVSEKNDVSEAVTADNHLSSARNEKEYITDIELGKPGGWTQVDDNTWKYVMPVFDDTAEYTYWEEPVDGDRYTSDAPDSKDNAVEKKAVLNGSENKTLVVTNTSSTKYGSITVSKKVVDGSNELTTSTQDFTFTLTLNKDGNLLSGTQVIGDHVFTNGSVTFTLHEGESKTFNNVPIGLEYVVHEDANKNYNYGKSLDVTGKVSADHPNVEVKNTFTPAERSRTDITLVKKAEGSVDGSQDDTYPFHAHLTGLDANLEFGVVIGSDDSNTTVQNYMSNAQGEADVTLNLKADQKAVFKDVPVGATYQFVEDAGKWTARYNVSNASGGTIVRTSGSNTTENQELATAIEKVDEGEQTTVTFTNTLAFTQKLTVKKTVSEDVHQIDPNEKFEVTVTITGLKPGAKIDTDSVGILTADDTGMAVKTFNLKNKQSVVFRNVPVSAQYQVKETRNDYVASYKITSATRSEPIFGANTAANQDLITELQTMRKNEDPTVELISRTHWVTVGLKKTDKDGTLLRGAQFTLYKGSGENRTEYKMNRKGLPVEENDSSASAVISLGEKTLTLASGTYELEETKAPRGYLITDDAKTVTFTVEGNKVTLISENKLASIETKDDQTPVIVIKNQAGTRLPSTGGMDVRILLLAALLMIGTSLFGFWKLRKDDSARKN